MQMEKNAANSQEDNKNIYAQMSKANIDFFITKKDYKKAFSLLVIVLKTLHKDQKEEFINYYNTKLYDINVFYQT